MNSPPLRRYRSGMTTATANDRSFFIVLALLMAMIVCIPILNLIDPSPPGVLGSVLMTVFFSGVMLTSVHAVGHSHRVLIIGFLLAVPAVATKVAREFLTGDIITVTDHVSDIIFLAFIVVELLRALFAARAVTANLIACSMCTYLILALWFASVAGLLECLVPGAYQVLTEVGDDVSIASQAGDIAVYYSFITITTLGYGDIVPMIPASRMLAGVEAIVGQFYMAILVARLVGMHLVSSAD
ncbi:MAG: potassium channel family protein [Planctomycetota bacterium]